MDVNESEILGDQAMIFFVISALISFSRSIILGKVDYENGKIKLKELIKKIIDDLHINKAIKKIIIVLIMRINGYQGQLIGK